MRSTAFAAYAHGIEIQEQASFNFILTLLV